MTTTPNNPNQGTQSPMQQGLESALTRYDDIWKAMEARRIIVETTILQLERYRKMVRSITLVLYKIEKKVFKAEPIGGEVSTIEKQILEHKVCESCGFYWLHLNAFLASIRFVYVLVYIYNRSFALRSKYMYLLFFFH